MEVKENVPGTETRGFVAIEGWVFVEVWIFLDILK